MKSRNILVLAALILALAPSAFPHQAAASTTTSSQAASGARQAGGSQLPYMTVELAADILSALLA
jgi:hypothetical protein